MTIAQLTGAMIARSEGNLHDINHFLKVWAYTRTIGQCEGLDDETQAILTLPAAEGTFPAVVETLILNHTCLG